MRKRYALIHHATRIHKTGLVSSPIDFTRQRAWVLFHAAMTDNVGSGRLLAAGPMWSALIRVVDAALTYGVSGKGHLHPHRLDETARSVAPPSLICLEEMNVKAKQAQGRVVAKTSRQQPDS